MQKGPSRMPIVEVREGKVVAYATDAGMPGVSDPGARVVLAWTDARDGALDIYRACSAAGGVTWGAAARVNAEGRTWTKAFSHFKDVYADVRW